MLDVNLFPLEIQNVILKKVQYMDYYSIWDKDKVTYIEPVFFRNEKNQQIELTTGFYETFFHADTIEEMEREQEEKEEFGKEMADVRREALLVDNDF